MGIISFKSNLVDLSEYKGKLAFIKSFQLRINRAE